MSSTIRGTGIGLNLQDIFQRSVTVVASPTDNTETIICTLTLPSTPRVDQGVYLWGFAAFTVGTSGTAARLRVRRTDASGTTKADSDALTATAANKMHADVQGFDALGATASQVYVLTLTVTAGAAASTVSNVALFAIIV